MPALPAECTSCGLVFQPPSGIVIENSTGVTIQGGGTTCPRCNGFAEWLSGTYDVRESVLELVSGPPRTIEALRRLATAVDHARQVAHEHPEHAAAIVAEVDGRLGRRVRQLAGSPELANFLAVLSLILTYMLSRQAAGEPSFTPRDVDQIIEIVREEDGRRDRGASDLRE